MNAVSNYGSDKIVSTGCVDFMYTELWGSEDKFSDLQDILKANRLYSGNKLGQVYAAYMDYGHKKPEFNAPGVLLTDAVMFALGASHLELGAGHMLSSEYFPYADVKMSDELKKQIVAYYDFLTAYQNLLRDGGNETQADIAAAKSVVTINATAMSPTARLAPAYSRAVIGWPLRRSVRFSLQKVLNVVKPPQNPVVSSILMLSPPILPRMDSP